MPAVQQLRQFRGRGLEFWRAASPATYGWTQRIVRRWRSSGPADPTDDLPPFGSTVAVDGITMRVDERMSAHNIRKLQSGRHTRHERDLLALILRPDDVVMELGGGIGMVAISCAKRIGSDRVFSYEANPRLEPLIRDNYALNQVTPTLRMCMVGPEAGSCTFYIEPRFSRSSTYRMSEEGEAISVPVLLFNDEVRRIAPSILVVDIQGGEKDFFDYADLTSLRALLVEVHADIIGADAVNRVRAKLTAAGFAEQNSAGNSLLLLRAA